MNFRKMNAFLLAVCLLGMGMQMPSGVISIAAKAEDAAVTPVEAVSAADVFSGFQYSEETDGTLTIIKCSNMSGDIVIPAQVGGITVAAIGSGAFENCTEITSVTFQEGVKVLYDDAFSGCTALKSVSLPSTLQTIYSGAFYNCTSLTEIEIPEQVTYIEDRAFYGCKNLQSVNLPAEITFIGRGTFQNSGLTSVTLPEGVSKICQDAFRGCTALRSVSLPSTLWKIEDDAFHDYLLLKLDTVC